MAFQKIACYLAVISGACLFVYSLGMSTDLFDTLYNAYDERPKRNGFGGTKLYFDIQDFNKLLTVVGIGLILVALILFVMQTHNRRKYYIGNYVAITLFSGAAVAAGVWTHTNVESYKASFLLTDFEGMKAYYEKYPTRGVYNDSTLWFDLHYVVLALMLLAVLLLVASMIWKVALMAGEAQLRKGKPISEAAIAKREARKAKLAAAQEKAAAAEEARKANQKPMDPQQEIKTDRMRFTKNNLSANLVLLGIIFNVIYFVNIFRSDVEKYYYEILIGASIIYNLIFLLAAFLCVVGVKSRKGNFWTILLALGAGQLIRILILPAKFHGISYKTSIINAEGVAEDVTRLVMGDQQFMLVTGLLIASAVCLILAAVTSLAANAKLNSYMKRVKV